MQVACADQRRLDAGGDVVQATAVEMVWYCHLNSSLGEQPVHIEVEARILASECATCATFFHTFRWEY